MTREFSKTVAQQIANDLDRSELSRADQRTIGNALLALQLQIRKASHRNRHSAAIASANQWRADSVNAAR